LSPGAIRIDKWLWYARFFKSRTLAARQVADGHVRVNSERVTKTHSAVRSGDVLTFPQGDDIRVVRIVEVGTRRGPSSEAAELFDDLEPPVKKVKEPAGARASGSREPGAGRPTKADRRAIADFMERSGDPL
jgi:ribosome-associated heat shock protein Hsp15